MRAYTHTLTHTGGYGQEGDCDSSSSAAYTPRDVSGTCVGAAAAAGGAAVNDFSKRHYLGGGLDSGRPHLPVDQTHAHVPAGGLSSDAWMIIEDPSGVAGTNAASLRKRALLITAVCGHIAHGEWCGLYWPSQNAQTLRQKLLSCTTHVTCHMSAQC